MFNQNKLDTVFNSFGFTLNSYGSVNPNSFGDDMCGGDDNGEEVLHNEKAAMRISLTSFGLSEPPGVCRTKNSEDSIKYRRYGNDLYKHFDQAPDDRTHEKVWRFYTQSIALAPNGSSELAVGYGNRSALLFHLERYEDCIKDCDRAMEITTCDFLRCKLMCRKAECLALLHKNSAKSICNEALKQVSELDIQEDLKRKFIDKLHNIVNTLIILDTLEENKPEDLSELTDLNYQKEAPCASKSIRISYSKKWGRHITATKDINPGEIVAIENDFCRLLFKPAMYVFCSNCAEPAWSSIPCRYCIYDVYCSERCKAEAWIKYHEYECQVYPNIWDIDQNLSSAHLAIRVLLIMIHNAGGIEQLKKAVADVERCNDLRTKGFSSEGVFHSDHPRSMYSHMYGSDNMIVYTRIYEASTNVHLLATKTDLFGKKMSLQASDMVEKDDILFAGALLARIHSVLDKHFHLLTHQFEKEKVHYGASLSAFNSLFNHSCNPNTEIVSVKNHKTVIYNKHPIKKGEQLFVSYRGNHYLGDTKKQRHKDLGLLYGFTCDCLACSENWSNICVPNTEGIFILTPGLRTELDLIFSTIKNCCITPEDGFQYSLESVKNIRSVLEILSRIVTVHCLDYNVFEEDLRDMFIKCFGNWTFDMPHKCISA